MKALLWIVLLAAVALAIRMHSLGGTLMGGQIYFVDADCYSRMTRARIIDAHPGTVIHHHEFENFPVGVAAHTTAPLDYLIVGLKGCLTLVAWASETVRTSILRTQLLDVAGALISPLLGVATALFLGCWARWGLRRAPNEPPISPWLAASAPLLFTVSPILVHGTLLGRPDHQSLLILLLAVALGADWVEESRPSRTWAIISGAAWGLALWVSLYEPLVLLAGSVLFRTVEERLRMRRLATLTGEVPAKRQDTRVRWAVLGGVLLLALLIERPHFQLPDTTLKEYFTRWASSIGELRHLDVRKPVLYRWLGWGCVASPVLLVLAARQDRRAISVLGLLLFTFALTCWQIRWGYFLALVFAMSLPWQLAVLRRRWIAWLVLLLSLWPTWQEWDEQLFPDAEAEKQLDLRHRETQQLRKVAEKMQSDGQAAFIAPWWLSPPVAYWSGQPGVAGSSHESLSGIVDTARFYTAARPEEAAAILRRRQVGWVIAEDAGRMLDTSTAVLGGDAPPEALANALAESPHSVPPFLSELPLTSPASALGGQVESLQFFRLYRVIPDKLSND